MQYEFDSGNLSSLVLFVFLLLTLTPITYRTFYPKNVTGKQAEAFPVHIQDASAQALVANRPLSKNVASRTLSLKHAALAVGWAFIAYLGYGISQKQQAAISWDPYAILGISESATEKEIKKHFKRMSIKFHPDKVRLAVNQTLEEVQNQFVDITKAYKALTDEDIRNNFLEFGHPDGRQDTAIGIALPSWMVEGSNSLWVLAAYCFVLLFGLPVVVGRWWYSTTSVTKEGIKTGTAELFFRSIEDDLTHDQIITLLSQADEFAELQGDQEEIAELASKIKEQGGVEITSKRPIPEVLLRAHLHRLPLSRTLAEQQVIILDTVLALHKTLMQICLAYGYLETTKNVMEGSACIVQALPPKSTPLAQLPHMTPALCHSIWLAFDSLDVTGFLQLNETARRVALKELSDTQYAETLAVAKHIPALDCCRVDFQVAGETNVVANAIVHLVLKVRRAGLSSLDKTALLEEEEDEGDVEAILRADERAAATAERDTTAFAPCFPAPPVNSYWFFMADHKQDRVIVGPGSVEDVGGQVRTFKLQFQAPPHAGMYTFQVHLKSDTYKDVDQVHHLELTVVDEAAEADAGDDDISEPDEDTLAGQMAVMKGEAVKRSAVDLEYASSSEEELDSTDESDSDSD
ncbi:Sec63 Brl domain-domain-containing protein [Protomyces lactucae-debilis]|uniref:Sec63 Brl domain-domain-containing protein n=1 Tax=Protomyces lactucae-debilis TaxID=2754530 RepID=A0A1Y2FC30_PROLT|nr:Sec63 Brl domain-containing protein [Protomyces lactucae-debilis]ORY81478.1 Sec63 Brl domain-domain-containing protein [Protomyces lactucae-debilis]